MNHVFTFRQKFPIQIRHQVISYAEIMTPLSCSARQVKVFRPKDPFAFEVRLHVLQQLRKDQSRQIGRFLLDLQDQQAVAFK
jgi:hypothetical protein